MYLTETHAHAQQLEHLRQAERSRRGHYLLRARRATRRAERAALQARLVLARSL